MEYTRIVSLLRHCIVKTLREVAKDIMACTNVDVRSVIIRVTTLNKMEKVVRGVPLLSTPLYLLVSHVTLHLFSSQSRCIPLVHPCTHLYPPRQE